jgi:proline iminopeptidase
MNELYPEIKPFQTFFLATDSKHQVFVEQCGRPDGVPVIFLHGGPCSGIRPEHRRFFDPTKYHIILFDQRGCGQSLPYGELENNTTQDLIGDMERIRQHLSIESWLVFGGSWGGTLALLYAQQNVERVRALIIRAVFLGRQKDLSWFTQEGAGRIYPEKWQKLKNCVPVASRENIVEGIYAVLCSFDELARLRIAKEWDAWGGQVALGRLYQPDAQNASHTLVDKVRLELHYARHHYFIAEDQVLQNCKVLQQIPTVIIHGRNDLVCPLEAGFSLQQKLPHAEFKILPNAGHVAQGKEMIDALVTATDNMVIKLTQ